MAYYQNTAKKPRYLVAKIGYDTTKVIYLFLYCILFPLPRERTGITGQQSRLPPLGARPLDRCCPAALRPGRHAALELGSARWTRSRLAGRGSGG